MNSRMTGCIQQITSPSLRRLSLNLIDAGFIPESDLPFNDILLQNLLQSITGLKQFHVYAELYNLERHASEFLSQFRNRFWFERN